MPWMLEKVDRTVSLAGLPETFARRAEAEANVQALVATGRCREGDLRVVKLTAERRARQLLLGRYKDLPPLGRLYAQQLGRRYGYCSEVLLYAYAAYAQCVEELPCDDPRYAVDEKDRQWFAANREP